MLNNSFQEILDFAQNTGDTCIILNEGKPFVVMPLDKYKHVMGDMRAVVSLTESELLDKINRDIAAWRMSQDNQDVDSVSEYDTIDDALAKEEDVRLYIEPVE